MCGGSGPLEPLDLAKAVRATRASGFSFLSRHNYFLDRGVKCLALIFGEIPARFMVVYKTPSIVGTNIFDLEKSGCLF